MNQIIELTLFIILFIIFIYCILKEREELGSIRFGIKRNLDDNNSVYVKNTQYNPNDTIKDLNEKIISIISYHEKGAIWRRCYIFSILLCLILFILIKSSCNINSVYFWICLIILYTAIIYFYFNFINYHHFRVLKNNGIKILEELNIKLLNEGRYKTHSISS